MILISLIWVYSFCLGVYGRKQDHYDSIQTDMSQTCMEARWPSGRALDSGARGWGLRSSLRSPCCVLEQDTFTSQKVLVIPRKRWLRPDMTENRKRNRPAYFGRFAICHNLSHLTTKKRKCIVLRILFKHAP